MDLTSVLLVVTIIFVIYTYYKFLTKNYDFWDKQNVPCLPNPIPGFGHILPVLTFYESINTFLHRTYKNAKSSMVGFYFMRRPGIIIRDPDLVRIILESNFSSFRENLIALSTKTDPVLSNDLFFQGDPDLWKHRRIQLVNNLSGKKLKYVYVAVEGVCAKMGEYLNRKIEEHNGLYECELRQHFIKCTGEVVANTALGIEGDSFVDNPHKEAFTNTAVNLLTPKFWDGLKQAFIFFLPNVASIFGVKFLPDHTEAFFRQALKTIIVERKKMKTPPMDFLQLCLESHMEDDIDLVIADLVAFHLDVYKTSSAVLSYFFYYLSVNKHVQDKLRNDIFQKLENKPLSYEALKDFKYLNQVLYESMRQTSPLGVLMKVCTEEITLTGYDGLKCVLKPGCPVLIPMVEIQRDEKYWPNTNVFDPDRFDPDNPRTNPKFAFIPFGGGPRMCIGMRLGMMLVKTAASTILTKYSLEPSSKTRLPLDVEIDPSTIVSKCKDGVWAKFKKLE